MTEISRSHPSLRLTLLPQPFFMRQTSDIPRDALDALGDSSSNGLRTFLSVTRTAEEWSVVSECVEADAEKEKATWRCIKVAGPMDFGEYRLTYGAMPHRRQKSNHTYVPIGLTGIMCDLSTPLKHAGVPIFAISTWYAI